MVAKTTSFNINQLRNSLRIFLLFFVFVFSASSFAVDYCPNNNNMGGNYLSNMDHNICAQYASDYGWSQFCYGSSQKSSQNDVCYVYNQSGGYPSTPYCDTYDPLDESGMSLLCIDESCPVGEERNHATGACCAPGDKSAECRFDCRNTTCEKFVVVGFGEESSCPQEKDCAQCKNSTNYPIDFSSGRKYLNETDFTNQGNSLVNITRKFDYYPYKERTDYRSLWKLRIQDFDISFSEIVNNWIDEGEVKEYVDDQGRWVKATFNEGVVTGFKDVAITSSAGDNLSFEWLTPDHAKLISSSGEIEYLFDDITDVTPTLTVNFPDGKVMVYEHDHSVDAQGDPTNTYGSLTSIEENGALYLSYTYNTEGYPIHEEKAGGFEATTFAYTFDTYGEIEKATLTNALGKVTNYNFITVPEGRSVIYNFIAGDGAQRLESVEGEASANCALSNSYYTYDSDGNQETVTDNNGNMTETIHDTYGQIITERRGLTTGLVETDASQKIITSWEGDSGRVDLRTYYGWNGTIYVPYRSEDSVYDANNRLQDFIVTDLLSVPNKSHTTNYNYEYWDIVEETELKIMTVDGPLTMADGLLADNADYTKYYYDQSGNQTSIENALLQTNTYAGHNAQGLPSTITDANGIVTVITYTDTGAHDTVTVDGILVSDYDYDTRGLLEKITLADGSWLQYTYNASHYLTSVLNNLGESIDYENLNLLKGQWQTEKVIESDGTSIARQRQRVFDELGRIRQLQGDLTASSPLSVDYGYDTNDNIANETDELARINSYQYDEQNRITHSSDPLQMDKVEANRNPIIYDYDIQGNIESVTDQNGNITQYIYNGFGKLITLISSDTGSTTYVYDSAGNLDYKIDSRSITTDYGYDVLGRLESVTYTSSPDENVSYTYDEILPAGNKGVGKLTSINDEAGATTYEYGSYGVSKTTFTEAVAGSPTFATEYLYDANGRVSDIVYPSGNIVSYGYDSLSRINSVDLTEVGEALQNLITDITYHPFAGIETITYENAMTVTIGNDLDGRVSNVDAGGLYSKAYSYSESTDANSNQVPLIGLTDGLDAENNRSYQFDRLSRLVDSTEGDTVYNTTSYGYDDIGNRTSRIKTDDGITVLTESLLYNDPAHPNRLQEVVGADGGDKMLSYDTAGNIVSQTQASADDITYNYNDSGRLSDSDKALANTDYTYNALGQRLLKDSATLGVYFQYNLSGQILSEHDQITGDANSEYIYVDGLLVAFINTTLNSAPVANDDSFSTYESQTLVFNPLDNDVDPEGEDLTIIDIQFDSASGNFVVNPDQSVTYTPLINFNGSTQLTYTVSDGVNESSAISTINVTALSNTTIWGNWWNDTLYGNMHHNTIYAQQGHDTIYGYGGNDTIWGYYGADSLVGGDGNDKLYGEQDNDRLYGQNGDDRIWGGTGADQLWGDAGIDYLYGDQHNDILYGGDGNDMLDGGTGNDSLYGQDGNDSLYGWTGNDQLYGGAGNDTLRAHWGVDTYHWYSGDGHDIIYNEAVGEAGTNDTLKFYNLDEEQLWFVRSVNNLNIYVIGEEGSVIIGNWYLGGEWELGHIMVDGNELNKTTLAALVTAMAAYPVPADTASIPADVQALQATSWGL